MRAYYLCGQRFYNIQLRSHFQDTNSALVALIKQHLDSEGSEKVHCKKKQPEFPPTPTVTPKNKTTQFASGTSDSNPVTLPVQISPTKTLKFYPPIIKAESDLDETTRYPPSNSKGKGRASDSTTVHKSKRKRLEAEAEDQEYQPDGDKSPSSSEDMNSPVSGFVSSRQPFYSFINVNH